ncbi:MAG: Phosphoribosylformylglycinamidine synthase subunit PurQ [Verrucomicrobia subdivision 3 bacterium]|nr:Phosphoribosylformylglycinamidine synthase subunit PurQ [Limisphaerales bacterium]MCS1415278.1 Phosphoribosylformylglycinamidine synthase subunit PurQ [Limisphaerales bacterium]
MKFSVLQFPGSNSDQDCVHAVRTLGHEARYLWHKESAVSDCDAVLVPGGFSYGDYLRAGAIAQFSPIMPAVVDFAQSGGLVLGICNGFQILCEVGLLPGALVRNQGLTFRCEHVYLRTANRETPFTRATPVETQIRVPIAHGEGCFVVEETTLEQVESNGQILWQYCDAGGNVTDAANPNGSLRNIAGVCNDKLNVAGLMPHPERACEAVIGSEEGKWILKSMIEALKERNDG